MINSIEIHHEVSLHEPITGVIDFYSRTRTLAHVELQHGEPPRGSREVLLVAGLNRIPFDTSIKDESGSVVLEAEIPSPDDRFGGNNRFRKSIMATTEVTPRRKLKGSSR